MDASLGNLIALNQFSTGRRLFCFYGVLAAATKLNVAEVATLAQNAIAADEQTAKLEQRWAQKRRSGKVSAKQAKAQKALQHLDSRVDRSISGVRDAAEAIIRAADEDEKELVEEVEHFLNEIFPNGVAAITGQSFQEESVSVKSIVARLNGDLAPTVAKLGLGLHVQRLAKLSDAYAEALGQVDMLDFGMLRAAREVGQGYVLRLVAKVVGTFDEPTGEHAEKRLLLLLPILKQNQAISDHIRARRGVPDVDPQTGEEEPAPGTTPDPTDEPTTGAEPK